MGKGLIISEIGSGEYRVEIEYDGRDLVETKIAAYETKIATLQTRYDSMPETTVDEIWSKRIVGLQITAMTKSKEYFETFPDNPVTTIYCTDLTEGISGYVGTIEIDGELRTGNINIQPGYENNSLYDGTRDGQIMPAIASGPWSVFLNKSMLPGWQRWNPTFRYGTIVADSMDFNNDTCSVCLDPAYSSQQNLDINQGQDFSECESSAPSGFNQFCVDNPTHTTCTNTEVPNPLYVGDTDFETIKNINSNVNGSHEYKTDKSGYGVGELWAIMGPGETGDCEDFALTKMNDLIASGFYVKNLQLGWGYTESGVAHAYLMIQTANRGTLVLDNRYPEVMNADNVPYRFEGYQRAGEQWGGYTAQLEAVPIDYMSCNATAFADGDRVVVEFEGQDWNSPKVIGFESAPQDCYLNHIIIAGAYLPQDLEFVYLYSPANDTFVNREQYPETSRYGMALLMLNRKANIVGGFTERAPFSYGPQYWHYENDCDSDIWSQKLDYPETVTSLGYFGNLGGNGYVFGGREGGPPVSKPPLSQPVAYSLNTRKWDPDLETWSSKTNCLRLFIAGYEWTIGGFGYGAGGLHDLGSSRTIWDAIDKYNYVTDSWDNVHSLPVGMQSGYSFSIGDHGYFAHGSKIGDDGGMEELGHLLPQEYFTRRCGYYNPQLNSNIEITELEISPDSRSSLSGTSSGDDYGGYCIGGVLAQPEKLAIYNENADVWSLGASYPVETYNETNFDVYFAYNPGGAIQ